MYVHRQTCMSLYICMYQSMCAGDMHDYVFMCT